ncbi:porphobilinogen synthase [Rhizobium sp. PP-CC-3G-465]|nr:porphobilinogen synthase [Rhizobium sp. PP-CC-3G-465]
MPHYAGNTGAEKPTLSKLLHLAPSVGRANTRSICRTGTRRRTWDVLPSCPIVINVPQLLHGARSRNFRKTPFMTDKTDIVDLITGHRRMRRNRKADWTRRMVRENQLTVDDLIWPIFLVPGTNVVEPIAAMPGVMRLSVDKAAEAAREAADLGIPALATFPNVDMALRDDTGSHSLDADNLINQATRAIKKAVPGIGVITDVALDPFTSHGHDGILRDGEIVNDETVSQIARAAVAQANAGADIIAPSDMMDGRIGVIRQALDAAGHQNVGIMAYATKFASAFYGPYREAIGTSGLLKGDKKTYYIDPANGTEALRDAALDVEEGADMMMVKPGLPYLDICWRMKDAFGLPVFAYQVSGEYSMIKAAGAQGWIDEERVMMETMLAFKRAGCDGILSYFALDVARLLARKG